MPFASSVIARMQWRASYVQNRTHTIGFVSDVIATTPHAGRIIQGAQDLAWEHGYLLLVVNTGRNRQVLEAAVDMMLERRVDGMLYATMYHRAVAPPAVVREVPTVLLDCFVEDRSLPSVVPNEVKGGYVATKTLLDAGHRRIGFINNLDPVRPRRDDWRAIGRRYMNLGLPLMNHCSVIIRR